MSRKVLTPFDMTGLKVIALAPGTVATDAVNVSQIGFTFIQEATPTAFAPGNTWLNSATGVPFVWYDGFWVQFARTA